MYDPFQAYSAIGAYPGLQSPFQSPYTAFQSPAMQPMAAFNPIAGIQPQQLQQQQLQQLQLAQILAARAAAAQLLGASPFATGLQNPLVGTGFENPLLNPIFGQLPVPQPIYGLNPHVGQQFGPQVGHGGGLPYLQATQGLAPQSWVGQPMVHPLIAQQLAGRGLHGPWAGF